MPSVWPYHLNKVVAVYDDTTVRDTALPSPEAGEQCYVKNVGLQVYTGTFWRTPRRSVLYDLGVDLWLDARRGIEVAAGAAINKWTDQSGNAYAAEEATNPCTLSAAGLEQPHTVFDGTNDLITVPKAVFVNSLSALTVIVRCAFPAGADGYAVGRYTASGNQRSWALKYDNADDRPEWIISQLGSDAIVRYGFTNLDDGVFRTLGMTFDETDLTLYQDGVTTAANSGGGAITAGTPLFDSTADLVLGTTATSFCNVLIEQLAIVNRVLGADEMKEVHNEWANPWG